jgi:hypothetical protein
MSAVSHPQPFLEVRVEVLDREPNLSAACAGYELGEWRRRQLSKHVLQWLPEFALRYSEWKNLSHADAVAKVAKAALAVYSSPNYQRRGEFGEILLHILLRQHIHTIPAISKIYFKDSSNDPVKGFDSVHIVDRNGALELWLGEVKFYKHIRQAIRDVVEELRRHTERNYLRSEFAAIVNKLDDQWPRGQELRELIANNRSLDQIFSALCIPVLLTYDSEAVANHSSVTADYREAFAREVISHRESFCDNLPELPMRVHLFLLPLKNKDELAEEMDRDLRAAQSLS